MIQTTNFANYSTETDRFKDANDFRKFLNKYDLDGIEWMVCTDPDETLPLDKVMGIHLPAYNTWIDFWNNNNENLIKEHGNIEIINQYYGKNKEEFFNNYKKRLDDAQRYGVKYVVFHICDIGLEESLTCNWIHTDEEVVDTSIEFINKLLDNSTYTFDFLCENLWWPGMTFRRPEIVKRLLDGINYKNKGLILDTGHLMNSNNELKTPEEAVDFVNEIMDLNEEYIPYIKGIHLQLSLAGERHKEVKNQDIKLTGDYWAKWGQTFEYIFELDQHRPWDCDGVEELIKRIDPKYLTFEYITRSREELEEFLTLQRKYVGKL